MTVSAATFFSVVIPTYNRKGLVDRTIDSVLAQEYSPLEVVVVDDGSSDGTAEHLRKKYEAEPRVRVIEQVNQERGAARNRGIREAAGDYIVFLDSDDLLLPGHLDGLAAAIRAHQPDFLATKFSLVREGHALPTQLDSLPEGWYDYRLFLNGNALACNICVRKANPGLFPFESDRRYAIKEDWLFHLQNLRHNRLYLLDKKTVVMDDHDARSMRSDNRVIIARTFLALEWILKNVELSAGEQRQVRSHAYYFAAIHWYVDRNYTEARKALFKAARLAGPKSKYLILFMKSIVGKGLTDQVIRILRNRTAGGS